MEQVFLGVHPLREHDVWSTMWSRHNKDSSDADFDKELDLLSDQIAMSTGCGPCVDMSLRRRWFFVSTHVERLQNL